MKRLAQEMKRLTIRFKPLILKGDTHDTLDTLHTYRRAHEHKRHNTNKKQKPYMHEKRIKRIKSIPPMKTVNFKRIFKGINLNSSVSFPGVST